MIKIICLNNNLVLISKIEELSVSIGEPDCKLIDPFLINYDKITNSSSLIPWMFQYTSQNVLMISSEKILTIADPTDSLLKKYMELVSK